MSSIITLLFAGIADRKTELVSKIDLIDQLLDKLCICELTDEGRIVLNKIKQELKDKICVYLH